MNSQNELILNQRRDFGDVLGDSATFLKTNFNPILSVFLTLVVPLLLAPLLLLMATGLLSSFIEQISGEAMMNGNQDALAFSFVIGMLGFLLIYFLAYMALNLTVFGAFIAYEDNGNMKVTTAQIRENMKAYFGNYFVSLLVLLVGLIVLYIMAIVIVMIGAQLGVAVTIIMSIVMFCLYVWVAIVISNYSWIRIRENLGVGVALERSFALIKKNWWSMLGILLVASIAVSICSYVFSIPFYIFTFMTGASIADGEGMNTGMMAIIGGLSFFIYLLGSLFLQQYVTACSVFKYFDLVEQRDGSSVSAQIDQLGESTDSFFENEGEY